MHISGFHYGIDGDLETGFDFIRLQYRSKKNDGSNLEAFIVPALGCSLCRFTVGTKRVIDYDPALLKTGAPDFTGTPVLYPTPNRVRNGVFTWKGKSYRQEKGGRLILEHGLVYDEPWEYAEPSADDTGAVFTAWLDVTPDSPLFAAFPFVHRLTLTFTLTSSGLTIRFDIINKDDKEIPFGFGIHPYFQKLLGNEDTYVSLPARHVMDYTSDLLPTGRLIDVEGTIYDLRGSTRIGDLDMDHVFTGVEPGKSASIEYRRQNLTVNLKASDVFPHLVLYAPRGEKFFCLENQSCSTDAHNLFARGFAKESGLKTVAPGKQITGSVFLETVFI